MLGETEPQALSWRSPNLGHIELETSPILCGYSGSEGEMGHAGTQGEARSQPFGQAGGLLGGGIIGSGSGMMGRIFF